MKKTAALNPLRMTAPESSPTPVQVAAWLGEGNGAWLELTALIERNYSGVFVPEWLFGGKRHGWSLRYKKSRPLCTLVPEKGRPLVVIVFGGRERAKIEKIRAKLTAETLEKYDAAPVYLDGKWLALEVRTNAVLNDIEILLAVKRVPRPKV